MVIKNFTSIQVEEEILEEFFVFVKKKLKLKNSFWVNLYLVGEKKIISLKEKFFGIKQKTDVIAFPLLVDFVEDDKEKNLLGEIFICLPIVKKQAKLNKKIFLEELLFVFAHGVLHLLGFQDQTPASRSEMFDLQENLVNSFLEKNKI